MHNKGGEEGEGLGWGLSLVLLTSTEWATVKPNKENKK